jgi:hypothetical protein
MTLPRLTLPRSVADILKNHVTLEVEGIDRMDLNVSQPRLQSEPGVAAFCRFHRGEIFASSALMDPMSKSFIAAVERFVQLAQIVPEEILDDSGLRRGFDQLDEVIDHGIEQRKVPAGNLTHAL